MVQTSPWLQRTMRLAYLKVGYKCLIEKKLKLYTSDKIEERLQYTFPTNQLKNLRGKSSQNFINLIS